MASFFEKLKRGMGIEGSVEKIEETEEKEEISGPRKLKVKRNSLKKSKPLVKQMEIESKELQGEKESDFVEARAEKENWFESEGQLAIDVYQTETELVIQSAIAGVKPEDLDISIERDVLTIRGNRQKPFEENGDYFTQECYWGPFSRKVVLPVEIDPDRTEATMKDGILTIRLPKLLREKLRQIKVKG